MKGQATTQAKKMEHITRRMPAFPHYPPLSALVAAPQDTHAPTPGAATGPAHVTTPAATPFNGGCAATAAHSPPAAAGADLDAALGGGCVGSGGAAAAATASSVPEGDPAAAAAATASSVPAGDTAAAPADYRAEGGFENPNFGHVGDGANEFDADCAVDPNFGHVVDDANECGADHSDVFPDVLEVNAVPCTTTKPSWGDVVGAHSEPQGSPAGPSAVWPQMQQHHQPLLMPQPQPLMMQQHLMMQMMQQQQQQVPTLPSMPPPPRFQVEAPTWLGPTQQMPSTVPWAGPPPRQTQDEPAQKRLKKGKLDDDINFTINSAGVKTYYLKCPVYGTDLSKNVKFRCDFVSVSCQHCPCCHVLKPKVKYGCAWPHSSRALCAQTSTDEKLCRNALTRHVSDSRGWIKDDLKHNQHMMRKGQRTHHYKGWHFLLDEDGNVPAMPCPDVADPTYLFYLIIPVPIL